MSQSMRFRTINMCEEQSLRSACAYVPSDQSLCLSLEYPMIVKLLTEHHLEFLSLKGGCRGSSESTHVKMPHCWKSHALAYIIQGLASTLFSSICFENITTSREAFLCPNVTGSTGLHGTSSRSYHTYISQH